MNQFCETNPIPKAGPGFLGRVSRGKSCETNPIGSERMTGEVLDGKELMNDSPQNRRGKTKPIGRQGERPAEMLRHFSIHGRNARDTHGRSRPCRGTLLRETNPIPAGAIWRTSAVPTRTCNALDAGTARRKQSQFPCLDRNDRKPAGPGRAPTGANRAKQSQSLRSDTKLMYFTYKEL